MDDANARDRAVMVTNAEVQGRTVMTADAEADEISDPTRACHRRTGIAPEPRYHDNADRDRRTSVSPACAASVQTPLYDLDYARH